MTPTAPAVITKPMLFSGPMILRLLDGAKSQTRRVVKPQPQPEINGSGPFKCEWYSPAKVDRNGFEHPGAEVFGFADEESGWACPHPIGSLVWVRETFFDEIRDDVNEHFVAYRADNAFGDGGVKWKPAIFMPKHLSRITLEITAVRVERLNSISAEDAIAEGIPLGPHRCDCTVCAHTVTLCPATQSSLIMAYAELWDSIHGPGAWRRNEFVWCFSFRRIKP